MKINKAELAKKIEKLKSVVPKNSTIPALMGILVMNGKIIASNTEMTIQARFEGSEGEHFIIPSRAFDLIKNLPDGDLDISEEEGNKISISMERIKNTYQSIPAEQYAYAVERELKNGSEMTIDGETLQNDISHVLYAIPTKSAKMIMTALCMKAEGGWLDFTGLDGHVIAMATQKYDGDFELLIPKTAAEKLISLDISGKVKIAYDRNCAIFSCEEYEIYTRLVDGAYIAYRRFFEYYQYEVSINRMELLNAMIRVNIIPEERIPVKFEIENQELKLSIQDKNTDYKEIIMLEPGIENKMLIGFSSRLMIETLKAHSSEKVTLKFSGSNQPVIIESGNLRSIVLPVRIS